MISLYCNIGDYHDPLWESLLPNQYSRMTDFVSLFMRMTVPSNVVGV